MLNDVTNFLLGLRSKPSYVHFDTFDYKFSGDRVDIVMFGSYHIEIELFDDECLDTAYADSGGYGKQDLEYIVEILDNRDKILEIINN